MIQSFLTENQSEKNKIRTMTSLLNARDFHRPSTIPMTSYSHLCSGAILYGQNAVQYDKCEMWIHNECYLITESEFDSVKITNCTWICPKCDFFNFSDSFFADQLNLEYQNRFDPLAKDSGTKAPQTASDKDKRLHALSSVFGHIGSQKSNVTFHHSLWVVLLDE